eukprot:5318616-Pleurochrysis_carterae.AAC.1
MHRTHSTRSQPRLVGRHFPLQQYYMASSSKTICASSAANLRLHDVTSTSKSWSVKWVRYVLPLDKSVVFHKVRKRHPPAAALPSVTLSDYYPFSLSFSLSVSRSSSFLSSSLSFSHSISVFRPSLLSSFTAFSTFRLS